MPDFAVGTAFTSKDRVTGAFKKMGKGADRFGRKSESAFGRASRAGSRFKDITKGILTAGALSKGIGLLSRGLGEVTRQYIDFDNEITGATARFKAAEAAGTDMTVVMKNLRKAARETGAATEFTAAQAAFGLNKFALAGFNSAEAMAVLRSQVDLTTVTGEDFGRVADISSDLLGGFGGAALESTKKIAMLKNMNAQLAVATLSANVTMETLFDTLKDAAPIGTALGKSMSDVISTAAVLGSAGIKGTGAATAMKNIFLRLAAPTSEVSGALRELNLNQRDFVNERGKMKSTADIFGLIGEKTKGMDDVKVVALFKALAGLRGAAGGTILAGNIKNLRDQMIRMAEDPETALKKTAAFMRGSFGNRIEALKSAAIDFGFHFFEALDGDAKNGVKSLTDAIRSIDPEPLIKVFKLSIKFIKILLPWIPKLIAGYLLIKTSLFAILVVQKAILASQWIPSIIRMTLLSFKFGARLSWLAIKFAISTASMIANKVALLAGAVATTLATAATWAFGVAMAFLTSPITLVILAVAALGAGLYLLVKNWDVVKAALISGASIVAEFFKTTFYSIADVVLFTFGNLAKGIISLSATIGNALGFDMSGLDSQINKFEALQRSIGKKSVLGLSENAGSDTDLIRKQKEEAPNAAQVRAIQENRFQADINFANLPKGAEVKKKQRGAPFVNLQLLGAQ